MQHTSTYMRLILQAKTQDANNATTGASLHTRLQENPKEGTNLLRFIYGQFYNDRKKERKKSLTKRACKGHGVHSG
jgi:hypothetical protein